MIAIVLAAGMSKRLHPYTEFKPKTLLPLKDKCILDYILFSLENHPKVEKVYVVTGHGHEHVKEHIARNFNTLEYEYVYNPEYNTKENIYSVYLALLHLKKSSDILIINSDVVFESKIMSDFLDDSSRDEIIIDNHKVLGEEEMKVFLTADGEITKISKKLDPPSSHGEYIGVAKISADSLPYFTATTRRMIEQEKIDDYYEQIFQQMADEGKSLHAFYFDSHYKWIEVDTFHDLEIAKGIVQDEN